MREQVIQVVERYIDAVRRNDASALPLDRDAVSEFPTNTYRGAALFQQGLDQFARIMKSIDVIRLIGRWRALLVANGEIVSIRGYCDPRPMLGARRARPDLVKRLGVVCRIVSNLETRLADRQLTIAVGTPVAQCPRTDPDGRSLAHPVLLLDKWRRNTPVRTLAHP